MKKVRTGMVCLLFLTSLQATPREFSLLSPDRNLEVVITVGEGIHWTASYKGETVMEKVAMALEISDPAVPWSNREIPEARYSEENQLLEVVVPNKDRFIRDCYNQLELNYNENYKVVFRAYNEGLAYRFNTNLAGEIMVKNEIMDLDFPSGTTSLFPKEESLYSHYERLYIPTRTDSLKSGDFCSLPVLFKTRGINIVFTEAALHDYPGCFLQSAGGDRLHAMFPNYVLEAVPNRDARPDRNEIITKKADYIAKTVGKREFPWRVFLITDDDRQLVESNLVYQLSQPLKLDNTDWIKPGRVAWDWYNANNIFGVDFRAGINTDTYKYYIDFAAENGIEYVILDEGWTKSTTEILECNPDLDVAELIAYSKEKNVGIILWVLWKPLNENLEEILDRYASWGARGIKVDFMQRADQYMVNSYEVIAREAARRELLVDFHGAFKPAGLRRKYPNVLSFEGVKGNENNKWSADITPEHTLVLPFTRMVAGPMDFTPGSMRNYTVNNFNISFFRPESMGTRCHQVAMYVVYESPIQMLCENPSLYRQEQETLDFIVQIPSVWDETHVLRASVGDYILIARRHHETWYVGAMTDSTPREFELDLSFLPEGSYTAEIMQDGLNADQYAEDYKKISRTVNTDEIIPLRLVSGGGWAAILKKQ